MRVFDDDYLKTLADLCEDQVRSTLSKKCEVRGSKSWWDEHHRRRISYLAAHLADMLREDTTNEFVVLGEGHFSVVVRSPFDDGLVVKIGTLAEDSAAAYSAWCRENSGLQGVPDIKLIRRVSQHFYFVIMPEYEPLEWYDYEHSCAELREVLCDGAPRDLFQHLEGPKEIALLETALRIRSFFEGVAVFDLHSQNVMKDCDGNIIITDPVSFRRGEEPCEEQYTTSQTISRVKSEKPSSYVKPQFRLQEKPEIEPRVLLGVRGTNAGVVRWDIAS